MAKKTISRTTNESNLRYFSKLLIGIEHFIFFGTLLGLERDNKIIEWDDDIDFYVDSKERDALIGLLRSADIEAALDKWPNDTPYFLQVERLVGDETGLIDFYFYDSDSDPKYIWEKWNFHGHPDKTARVIKIPKKAILPIERKTYAGIEVNVPAKTAYLCKFLYGRSWKRPLFKGVEYRTQIVNNRPRVFVGKIGRIESNIIRILSKLIRALKR